MLSGEPRFGIFKVVALLSPQVGTGILPARHKAATLSALTDPCDGRTPAAKLIAFVLVMRAASPHGCSVGTKRQTLAISLTIVTLVGSLDIVLLATSLPRS